jgi:hypothetical protein
MPAEQWRASTVGRAGRQMGGRGTGGHARERGGRAGGGLSDSAGDCRARARADRCSTDGRRQGTASTGAPPPPRALRRTSARQQARDRRCELTRMPGGRGEREGERAGTGTRMCCRAALRAAAGEELPRPTLGRRRLTAGAGRRAGIIEPEQAAISPPFRRSTFRG